MSARRTRNVPPEFADYFALLLDFSPSGPDRDTRERLLAGLLSAPAPVRMQVGAALLDVLLDLRSNVEQASAAQAELRALCARLTAPPWHVATLLRVAQTSVGLRAVIAQGQSRRVIGFADDVDPTSLIAGDDVFLSNDMTLLTGVSPYLPGHGETAVFVRHAGDGRVVVSHRDEELLLETSGRLDAAALEVGDVLRIERMTFVAHERLAPAERSEVLFERVPDLGVECVGGQQTALKRLLGVLAAKLLSPERAAQYGIGLRRAVLLYGPPGNGKTLMAKVATAAVQRLSGGKAHFAIVKPAQFESPYVGQTEVNMRTCFRALLRAAQTGPAVLFLDEVDAIGRVRGLNSNHHGDRFLDALLAELDGFADRGSIAIIAATNRKDLLDPALLQRLTDVEVRVPRPEADAARAIFAIHLPASLPFDLRAGDAGQIRSRAVEGVVTRLYAPNAQAELCTLRLRDGKSRGVRAAELVSGRILEQIARCACERALLRELDGGAVGVRVADVDAAVDEALERMGSTITSRNAHAYLEDLPEDADVVKVERPTRKRPRAHRYLAAA